MSNNFDSDRDSARFFVCKGDIIKNVPEGFGKFYFVPYK